MMMNKIMPINSKKKTNNIFHEQQQNNQTQLVDQINNTNSQQIKISDINKLSDNKYNSIIAGATTGVGTGVISYFLAKQLLNKNKQRELKVCGNNKKCRKLVKAKYAKLLLSISTSSGLLSGLITGGASDLLNKYRQYNQIKTGLNQGTQDLIEKKKELDKLEPRIKKELEAKETYYKNQAPRLLDNVLSTLAFIPAYIGAQAYIPIPFSGTAAGMVSSMYIPGYIEKLFGYNPQTDYEIQDPEIKQMLADREQKS